MPSLNWDVIDWKAKSSHSWSCRFASTWENNFASQQTKLLISSNFYWIGKSFKNIYLKKYLVILVFQHLNRIATLKKQFIFKIMTMFLKAYVQLIDNTKFCDYILNMNTENHFLITSFIWQTNFFNSNKTLAASILLIWYNTSFLK